MDMGFKASTDSMMFDGAIVGILCVLPMIALTTILILSLLINRKGK